jgi:hypothetical protein
MMSLSCGMGRRYIANDVHLQISGGQANHGASKSRDDEAFRQDRIFILICTNNMYKIIKQHKHNVK